MYISSAPYCTGSYCRYDNLQIKIWKSEYLHLGIAQDPKNKRMGKTNCVSVMSNKFSFGPKIDDNFLQVMYDRKKHGGRHTILTNSPSSLTHEYAASAWRKSWASVISSERKREDILAKKENAVLWRKTAENRDYNSPPYITASQWSHDQVSQPHNSFQA